ncbi:MAG: hypothetical protein H7839_19720 [Magnetococcus sp. YQC-5]
MNYLLNINMLLIKAIQKPSLLGYSVAFTLFWLDGFVFSQGVLSGFILFFSLGRFLLASFSNCSDQALKSRKKADALLLAIGAMAVIVMLRVNNSIAETRIHLVAEACRQYKASHGHYPQKLEELVPKFLTGIPDAKPFGNFNKILYLRIGKNDVDDDTLLEYVAIPPFSRRFLRLETNQWHELD